MVTAHVFNEHLNSAERRKLEEAVRAADHAISYGAPSDIAALSPGMDVGVVGIPVAQEDEDAVNEATDRFTRAGLRVIAIWLREDIEVSAGGVPEGIEKFGSATVTIESGELGSALTGDAPVSEQPDGTRRPDPKTSRNKC